MNPRLGSGVGFHFVPQLSSRTVDVVGLLEISAALRASLVTHDPDAAGPDWRLIVADAPSLPKARADPKRVSQAKSQVLHQLSEVLS